MNYTDKLKDGRWQKKRLQVMERDNFECQHCGSQGFLNVHHQKYTGNPWDAPLSDLITLCEPCHRNLHIPSQPTQDQIKALILELAIKRDSPTVSESAKNTYCQAISLLEGQING